MDKFELLIMFLKYIGQLFPLPTWTEKAAVRTWLNDKFVPIGKSISVETVTPLDDVGVAALEAIVASDTAFDLLYGLLFREKGKSPEAIADDVTALANETKLDPALIILIVEAILKIIELFKNRNN